MTIENKFLTGEPVWSCPQSTVNGQADDQAYDEKCFQALANRTSWLRSCLGEMHPGTLTLFQAIAEEKSTMTNRWRYCDGWWQLDGVENVANNTLALVFPIDQRGMGAITGASIRVAPASGHSAVPAQVPSLSVARITTSGYEVQASVLASASSVVDYETARDVSMVCDVGWLGSFRHVLVVRGECGNGAIAGLKVHAPKVTYLSNFALDSNNP